MAQDLRKLFDSENNQTHQTTETTKMAEGHEARFLKKLEEQLPVVLVKNRFGLYQIAASVVVFLGLSFGVYQVFKNPSQVVEPTHEAVALKSLGDISPDLKKVEDYYMANINLELSNVKLTADNKEVFDGYVAQLEELNKEYKRLSVELTESGPNELTVSALIDNLKLRLNLLYRFKEQLNELNTSDQHQKVM